MCRCLECDRRFHSQIQLEYHKDATGHWTDDDFAAYFDAGPAAFEDLDSVRDVMDDEVDEFEAEYGPDEEEREMLL